MKIYYTLILIFLVCIFSANAEINIYENDYLLGDTVQVEIAIDGLVDEIEISDLKLYFNKSKVSTGFFMVETSEKNYFVYFDIPLNFEEGIYEFVIDNANVVEEETLKKKSFSKNFSVNSGEDALKVNPAIIKTYEENVFEINLKNNGNKTLNINILGDGVNVSKESIQLSEGDFEKFQVLVNKIGEWGIELSYGKVFKVPIYFIGEEEDLPEVISKDGVKFTEDLNIVNLSLSIGEIREGKINFKNFYNDTISGIGFKLEGNINVVVDINSTFVDLNAGEEGYQYLWINRANKTGFFSGNLIMENDLIYDSFPIFVMISGNENGDIFVNESEPDNETIDLGLSDEREKRSYKWLWAISIIVVIGIIIFFIGRGRVVKKNIGDIISQK